MSRREQIESMLRENPEDTFLRYSLAMEHRKEGNTDEAIAGFRRLIEGAEPFVPAFFMAGQTLADHGEIEGAREMLRHGIDEARRQGDNHAAAEMSELLGVLGELDE